MVRSLEMAILLLHLLFVIIFAEAGADQQNQCTESRCSQQGPAIRFPFRLKGQEPEHCGYPGFDLYCNDENQTVFELPSSAKLLVTNINYKSQEILVYKEHGCLFPYLNLSASPFQFGLEIPDPFLDKSAEYNWFKSYNNSMQDYTLFNCSPINKYRELAIPCLSAHGYRVHAFQSRSSINTPLLVSCTKMYDIPSVPYYIFYNNLTFLQWSYSGYRLKNSLSEEAGRGAKTRTVVGGAAIVGFFLLVLIIILALYCKAHSSDKTEKENQLKIEKFLENYRALIPTRYSYTDIKRITNQFKEKLGQGGYGIVFKGKLFNEIFVAVKILNDSTGNGEEFINEVRTMGTIHHVNVVRLVGFCADGFKRALVYEFMPNESLDKFIFSTDDKKRSLSWERLQDIATGIAKGIEYLHQGCDQRILHFDIKSHNILLDHNFSPKISDFGMAKLCSKGKSVVSMTAARGTMGYIAPEVLSRNFGNVSCKADVYSFGMLLLEMVGGRKNIDVRVESPSQVYFPEWIYDRLDQGQEVRIRIKEEGDANIAKKLTIVGLWCIQWYPVDRPSMKIVLQMFEGDGDNLTIPPNPFVSTIQTNSTAIIPGRHFSRELEIIPELD